MAEDPKDPKNEGAPKPVYAPTEQSILPGYKKYVPAPPKDWRQWSDGRGNKLDAPKWQGRTSSGGKTVAPLVGDDGQPIRLGTLQIIRDARGNFVVIDWSKPLVEPLPSEGDKEGVQSESFGTAPIMGKQVYKTNQGLPRAKSAMAAIFAHDKEKAAGLLPDPAPSFDLAGQRIQIERNSLCQYARGKWKGRYAIVDEGVALGHERRVIILKETRFKDAVNAFVKIAKKRQSAPKKKRFVGAPIAFNIPSGFGGGGGGGFSSERELPEPGSLSWQTSVELFAQTGKWCETAKFPTGRPAALEEEAREARTRWLEEDAKRPAPVDSPEAIAAIRKLPKRDKAILNQVLEEFDAVLVSLELPGKAK